MAANAAGHRGLLVAGREWIALIGRRNGGRVGCSCSPGVVDWHPWWWCWPGFVVQSVLRCSRHGAVCCLTTRRSRGCCIWGAVRWHKTAGTVLKCSGLGWQLAAWRRGFCCGPLSVLELDDASAKSLGLSLHLSALWRVWGWRCSFTGSIVSVVGIIWFYRLGRALISVIISKPHSSVTHSRCAALGVAPAMVDAIGWRWLLATTDLLLQAVFSGMAAAFIPTGAITGCPGGGGF